LNQDRFSAARIFARGGTECKRAKTHTDTQKGRPEAALSIRLA
jgi:hypothetical protein